MTYETKYRICANYDDTFFIEKRYFDENEERIAIRSFVIECTKTKQYASVSYYDSLKLGLSKANFKTKEEAKKVIDSFLAEKKRIEEREKERLAKEEYYP